MRERDLERLLRQMHHEEYAPSAELLRDTRRRLYASRLLRVVLFASLSILALGCLALMAVLFSPRVPLEVKVLLGSLGLVIWGATLLSLVAARRSLVPFFLQLEAGGDSAA